MHAGFGVTNRTEGRLQITTDGLKAYIEAIEDVFGTDVDYAQPTLYRKPAGDDLSNSIANAQGAVVRARASMLAPST